MIAHEHGSAGFGCHAITIGTNTLLSLVLVYRNLSFVS